MKKQKKLIHVNKKIESYFKWPAIYTIIISAMTVVGALFDFVIGLIFLGVLLIALVIDFYILFFSRKRLINDIYEYALKLDGSQNELLNKFEMPYILMDSAGRVHWFNEKFVELIQHNKIRNIRLSTLIPVIQPNVTPFEENSIERIYAINNRIFKIVFNKIVIEQEEDIYAAYLFDISKQTELENQIDEQKTVFALLYVDNYEEVIHSIEEVRRPLLIALIDRNINKLAKDIDGVTRKFEKDKYFIVFQKKYLQTLQENKFSILDIIREINIGNEISSTLSIGIGLNNETYANIYDNSRVAMDLALGRGGDQAVIKEDDKLSFYGGKTRGVEKQTRVKSRIKAHAFRELLEGCERVIIMGHKVADMDSLGAALGVYASAKSLGKPSHIILNKATAAVSALYTRIVEDKEYGEDLFINNQQAMAYLTEATLLVVVDVNRPSYTEYPDILKVAKKIVVFDHHRVTAEHIETAVLSYIEPYASSTCEMISEIIQYISDKIKLRPVEADALFAGISVDTKNFVAKTGVKTFEAAAFLRRSGADAIRVSKFFKNDMASYKARATAVKDAEIYKENIAITVCPADVVNPNLVGAQAADELLNITGIKSSFVLTEIEHLIYISARSIDDVNVQIIMEKLGGGGHMTVAGAQLENSTIEKAKISLKYFIDEYFEKGEK